MELERTVLILRGISGSGKSTVVDKRIVDEAQRISQYLKITPKEAINKHIKVCSADSFFMVDDQYTFDPTKISEAHGQCMREYLDAITNESIFTILVDNTNTELWEYSPYTSIANAYYIKPIIIEVRRDIAECIQYNAHQVPKDVIIAQYKRFKPTPPFYQTEIVYVGKKPSFLTKIKRKLLIRY